MRVAVLRRMLAILVCLGIGLPLPAQTTLRLGACEWEPFTGESVGNAKGFLTEIAVAALSKMGYAVHIDFYPWARALGKSREGENDGLLGASYTAERTAFLLYPDPIYVSPITFWARKGRAKVYESPEALGTASVGVLNGSYLAEELARYPNLRIDLASDVELNVRKLALGRIDYLIESVPGVRYLLRTSLKEIDGQIEPLYPAYEMSKLYLAFSKKGPNGEKLVRDFNAGLKAIKLEGSYERILASYGLSL